MRISQPLPLKEPQKLKSGTIYANKTLDIEATSKRDWAKPLIPKEQSKQLATSGIQAQLFQEHYQQTDACPILCSFEEPCELEAKITENPNHLQEDAERIAALQATIVGMNQ